MGVRLSSDVASAAPSTARNAYTNIALMAGLQALSTLTQPGPQRPGKDSLKANLGDASQVWPYIAGTVKMYPHLIWYGDYHTKKVKNKTLISDILIGTGIGALGGYVAGGGNFITTPPPTAIIGMGEGAALGGINVGVSALRTASYKHFAGFAYGICHGPIDGIKTVWVDDKIAATGSSTNAGSTLLINNPKMWGGDHELGGLYALCDIVTGNFYPTQLPNTYWASQVPTVTAYSGKALFVWQGPSGSDQNSGYFAATPSESPLVRPIALEVVRLPNNLGVPEFKACGSDSLDANPAEVAYEWITNRVFGGKLSASRVDLASFQDGAETHFDEGLGMSLELNREYDVESALDDISALSDSVICGSLNSGTIKYKPIRRTYSIASLDVFKHGNDTSVTDKTDYNVLEIEHHELGTWKGTANDYRLEYINRSNKYQVEKQPAFDTANRIIQGRTVQVNKSFKGVALPGTAALVATREMRAASFPRPTMTIYVNRDAYAKTPGDVIKLISYKYGWTKILRILEVGIGKEADSRIRLVCVEDLFGVSAAAFSDAGSGGFTYPLDAVEIDDYVVQDAPYLLTRDDDPITLVFAAKPNSAQVKYDLLVSTDAGVSYTEERSDSDFAIKGTITEAVDRLTDVKLTSLTFTPANAFEAASLESVVSTADIESGFQNLIYWADTGEWGAVEDITDNEDGTFTLGNIWRAVGGFDSVPAPHLAGSAIWFFSARRALTAEHAAATSLRLKLISNAPGGDYASGSATAITHVTTTRAIKPIPVRGVTISASYSLAEIGSSDNVVVAWAETNRTTEATVKLQTDAGVAPEATTTYTVRWYAIEGATILLHTESGIAASTGSQTATMTTAEEIASPNYLGYLSTRYRVQIDVLRDGYTSTTYIRELTRAGGSSGLINVANILPAQIFDEPFAVGDDVDLLGVEFFS